MEEMQFLKKLMIICLMVTTINISFSATADASITKKTHISSMAQLRKSAKFMKKTQLIEPLACPISANGQAVYASIASIAPEFIGVPYVFGGKSPAGFDCSGFIYYIHQFAGLDIVRMSAEDYYKKTAKVLVPEVGDLEFFKDTYKVGISHMGIYLGDKKFVHAGSKGLEITNLDNVYWKNHFVGFQRFNIVTSN